ncbi:MAG: EamA family transporter [Candidatus Aenigmatarchaeota archaeon]
MLGEVILAIIAAVIGGLSLSIQKLGLDKVKKIRPKDLIKSKTWIAGILLALTGFTIYIYALSVGKIAIIQPLMETAMVFSIIFNYLLFREKLSRFEGFCFILVFIGIILIAFGG